MPFSTIKYDLCFVCFLVFFGYFGYFLLLLSFHQYMYWLLVKFSIDVYKICWQNYISLLTLGFFMGGNLSFQACLLGRGRWGLIYVLICKHAFFYIALRLINILHTVYPCIFFFISVCDSNLIFCITFRLKNILNILLH